MDALIPASIAFALSQLLLSLLLLWRLPVWRVQERLYAILLLVTACYLLLPAAAGSWWHWLLAPIQTAVPGMIWLFSLSVFDDRFRMRGFHVAIVASTVVLPFFGGLLSFSSSLLFFDLPQLLEFVLLVLTLWSVASRWRGDLIARRRRLRLWFVASCGAYALALIFLREVFWSDGHWLLNWQYLPLALLLLGLNTTFMQYREEALFGLSPEHDASKEVIATPTPIALDAALNSSLQALMNEQRAYAEMGLTIGKLAAQLNVPEYRLRETINAGLGFRNFNEYLNGYRIAETALALSDEKQDHLPILTIAMEAGFRSLSSFNKAFKEAKGITPTAFRKKALQEGAGPKNSL